MHTYVLGDLQGCADELAALLGRIADACPSHQLIFLGDLVNRGPGSLAALRQVHALARAGRAQALLGNHDLHLLAVAAGVQQRGRSDSLDQLLAAPDCGELLGWLRQCPLALQHKGHLLVHAGVAPQWDAAQTLALAHEVESALRGPNWVGFLGQMYGNEPARWDDTLHGVARLRCIVNALTRMRLCTAEGSMDFTLKESATAPAGSDLMPWFDVPTRRTADVRVVFGHWSALGLMLRADAVCLDSGCVWGGQLSALCLDDQTLLQLDCAGYQRPAGGHG